MEKILEVLKIIQAVAPLIGGIIDGGSRVLEAVKTALKDNDVEVDTAALDAIVLDAEARRDRAKREAEGS